VLDAPATGHGVHFLEAPEKTTNLLVGKLKERALEIKRGLEDPALTEIVIVTVPEEMPVRETLELAAALRRHAFPVDNVVVNRWLPPVFDDPGSAEVLARFASDAAARRALGRAIAHRTRIDAEEWFSAVSLLRREREENLRHLGDLRGIGAKVSLVPYLGEGERRLEAFARAMREGRAA
jgi:anion-transporting  ArsA/GET3 family ATPase